jgi:antibiotic biosynthesis monooxygenase (ABM) superfamily enzyme
VASPIALVPRVALISFPVSAMMTWIVEPQLARLPESWLYAPRRSK